MSSRDFSSSFVKDVLNNATAGLGTRFAPEHVAAVLGDPRKARQDAINAALGANEQAIVDAAVGKWEQDQDSPGQDSMNGTVNDAQAGMSGEQADLDSAGLGQAGRTQYYIIEGTSDFNWASRANHPGANTQYAWVKRQTGYDTIKVAGFNAIPVVYSDVFQLFGEYPVELADANGNPVWYMGVNAGMETWVPQPAKRGRRRNVSGGWSFFAGGRVEGSEWRDVPEVGNSLQSQGFDLATASGTIHVDPWIYQYIARSKTEGRGSNELALRGAAKQSIDERAAGVVTNVLPFGDITPTQAKNLIKFRENNRLFISDTLREAAAKSMPVVAPPPGGGVVTGPGRMEALFAATIAAAQAQCPQGYVLVPPGAKTTCPTGYRVDIDPVTKCQACVPIKCPPGYRYIPSGYILRCPTGYLTQFDPQYGSACQACAPLCQPGYAVPPCPPGQYIVNTDPTGRCVQCGGTPTTPGAGPGGGAPSTPGGGFLPGGGGVPFLPGGGPPAPTPTTTTPPEEGKTLFAGMGGAPLLLGLAALAAFGIYKSTQKKGTGPTAEAQREAVGRPERTPVRVRGSRR